MQRHLLERAFSFCLAAAVTLTVLGGLEQLATPHEAQSLWALVSLSNV